MTKPFTFAHFSDLHLPIATPPGLAELLGKRALGYLSWRRRRRRWHQPAVAEALIADMKAKGCAGALLSGDIVNISTEAEFLAAEQWLGARFTDLPLTITPGNHDAYVPAPWDRGLGRLGRYMIGAGGADLQPRPRAGPQDFPFRTDFGRPDLAVIVANSAPPTAPGLATGSLGRTQIGRIEAELRAAAAAGRFAILMLHHPVLPGVVSRRKALVDRDALLAAIARAGVDLVLHGHAHVAHFGAVDTPTGPAPVLGAGSVSHPRSGDGFDSGRYNLLTLARTQAGRWRLNLEVRRLAPETGGVVAVETRVFERPARTAA
jgi:3',5'-cyclic AMP phosphodiesterase CpdA